MSTTPPRGGLQAGAVREAEPSPQGLGSVHARPLDGIGVVTLEHAIAAPFCTRQQRKASPPDVKHPEAGPVLVRLMEKANVLVQNLAPGAAAAELGWTEAASPSCVAKGLSDAFSGRWSQTRRPAWSVSGSRRGSR